MASEPPNKTTAAHVVEHLGRVIDAHVRHREAAQLHAEYLAAERQRAQQESETNMPSDSDAAPS